MPCFGSTFRKIGNSIAAAVFIWFLTVPPATAEDVTFAAIGDYGNGSTEEGAVAGLVSGWNPAFIVTMSDNRYGLQTFDQVVGQFYCDYLADAGSGDFCAGGNSGEDNAFFPSLGNHDYTDGEGLPEYLAYFTLPDNERYYDFTRGPVHFFVIDSEGALSNSDDMASQSAWLQERLTESTSQWNIVYFHHPPYSSGSHGSNDAMQWPFAEWGADAVISGHDHTYERIFSDGIVYFVNGLGGQNIYNFNKRKTVPDSQVRYNGDYGAMRVVATDTDITFDFINTSAEVIDTYTIRSSQDPQSTLLPAAPTNLTATLLSSGRGKAKVVTGVELNWYDNSDNETSFVIERCLETGKGKNKVCDFEVDSPDTVEADITRFTDASGSDAYQYRVKAVNGYGDSAYSNTAGARN